MAQSKRVKRMATMDAHLFSGIAKALKRRRFSSFCHGKKIASVSHSYPNSKIGFVLFALS